MESRKTDLKNRRVLVVEDDPQLRGVLCKILDSMGAEVLAAENGLIGKGALDRDGAAYSIVFSDVKMPEMDGIALLKHCKQSHPQTKFIIFTGFSEVLEAQEASELGADAFMAKPFRMDDLMASIESVLASPAGGAEADEQAYCRVAVDEFLSSTRIPSDIYVRLATKFIKIAKENTEIDVNRLKYYKEKKVDYFYVRTADFSKYTGLNLKLAKAVGESARITPDQKMRLYKHTSEVLVQQIFVSGLKAELCQEAQGMVTNTLNMIGENEDLFELLLALQAQGDRLYAQSLGVAVYSCLIAKKLGWSSAPNQYKLMLAGLFHKIGFKELTPELAEKPRAKMTADEVKLYETYPARGRNLLLSVERFPGDLATLVFQHRENVSGTGFPMGISGQKIHPLAKVTRLAYEIAERCSQARELTTEGAAGIVLQICETKSDEFDTTVIGGALDLFEAPRPASMRKKSA